MTSAAFQQKCVPGSFSNDCSLQQLKPWPKSSTPADQLSKMKKNHEECNWNFSDLAPSKEKLLFLFLKSVFQSCLDQILSICQLLFLVQLISWLKASTQFVRSVIHSTPNLTGQRDFKTEYSHFSKLVCLTCLTYLSVVSFSKMLLIISHCH